MNSLNVSVLATAHNYYQEQLKLHLTPLIQEGIISLYDDAFKIEEETREYEGNTLKQFQKQLLQIPKWNQSILEEETRRILTEVDFLMELVGAVFIAHVKILSSVQLGGQQIDFRIRIPTSDIFIHAVYCKAAETFYYNPYIFLNYHVRENKEYIREMINRSITDTINDMIPIEAIIKQCISGAFNKHIKPDRTEKPATPEPLGTLLDNNDLGLGNSLETPNNDDFGIGNDNKGNHFGSDLSIGKGGDEFVDNLEVGKDSNLQFKDDETEIFSRSNYIKDEDSSPFKNIGEEPEVLNSDDPVFKPNSSEKDDPFKAIETNDDPFKSTGAFDSADDPFKSSSEDPFKSTEDPFKSTEDPFKNDPGIGSGLDDIPSPPELEKDGIFSQKPEELNFFDDVP
jgi:hypothetical protein